MLYLLSHIRGLSMDVATLAYLAGAMDSDGFFSIKKSTYHLRVRKDAVNATYSERVGLKQVTPHVPTLLRDTFGGSFQDQKPGSKNGRPLFSYNATDRVAANICAALRPYLRIKAAQCDLILEMGTWRRTTPGAHRLAWWWVQENPDWPTMPMLTAPEVAAILGHTHPASVHQCLRNGTLVSLPYTRGDTRVIARFPEPLVRLLATHNKLSRKGGAYTTPPQLIAVYDALHERVRMLNRIGTGEHPITMRTGIYTPAVI